MLSFFPRSWLQRALFNNWRRIRLDYWGTTGNPVHHLFAWGGLLIFAGVTALTSGR